MVNFATGARLAAILALSAALAACETPPTAVSDGSASGRGSTSGQTGGVTGQQLGGATNLGPATAEALRRQFEQAIGDRVQFATDSHDLSGEARRRLDQWVQWLRQNPQVRLTIEGHTDERGTREYNLGLGDRRATAVKNYLVNAGIQANRLQTISYGKERPVAAGGGEAAWAQNRRAVGVVGI